VSQAGRQSASNELTAKLWWAVPVAALLLLAGLALVVGGQQEPLEQGTSYDASEAGYRAAYLLLEELGFPVVRSKQPTGGSVRLVLVPESEAKDVQALEEWVREGGVLVLAVELKKVVEERNRRFEFKRQEEYPAARSRRSGVAELAEPSRRLAEKLGLKLEARQLDEDTGEEAASGEGVNKLQAGDLRVVAAEPPERVLCKTGDKPVVSVYRHGGGEIWLLNRPRFLSNEWIGKADNAVLLCRLMRDATTDRDGPIAFDEFVHGLRDRPGFLELLGRPPALWMTLQCVLATAIVLWHFVPRFGNPTPAPPPARRSKEEFLDAMATLLSRKGDASDAFRTARNELANEIGRELGLPPATPPEQIANEASRRLPINRELLLRMLMTDSLPAGGGPAALLKLMNELETIHDEFFDRSRPH
jgi:hypothetical protein